MNAEMSKVLNVGKELVQMCQNGKFGEAISELYADDAKHVEAMEMGPDMPRVTEGKAAIEKSNEWWEAHHEVHGMELAGPYPHGEDRFAVLMKIDVTPDIGPMAGKRFVMDEVCLYTVDNGKIKMAEFFYDPSAMEY